MTRIPRNLGSSQLFWAIVLFALTAFFAVQMIGQFYPHPEVGIPLTAAQQEYEAASIREFCRQAEAMERVSTRPAARSGTDVSPPTSMPVHDGH